MDQGLCVWRFLATPSLFYSHGPWLPSSGRVWNSLAERPCSSPSALGVGGVNTSLQVRVNSSPGLPRPELGAFWGAGPSVLKSGQSWTDLIRPSRMNKFLLGPPGPTSEEQAAWKRASVWCIAVWLLLGTVGAESTFLSSVILC